MALPGFGKLKTIVFIPPGKVRDGVIGALKAQGFGEIHQPDSIDDLIATLKRVHADLIISVTRTNGRFVGDVIRELRLGMLESSPFPIVLALLPSADEEHVKAVINAGVDDLLLMPLSPEALFKRIAQFVQDRRPFIITHNYIGPDRRQVARPGEKSALLIKVPNPVRSRMVGIADDEIDQAINDGILVLDTYKLKQDGIQLLWILSKFRPKPPDPEVDPDKPVTEPMPPEEFLRRCREVCGDSVRCCKGSAERGIRNKATTVAESVDLVAALGDRAQPRQFQDLCRSVEDLVDHISAYHGEQLRL